MTQNKNNQDRFSQEKRSFVLRNIKLIIEYEGTNYCGWQVQNSCQLSALSCQRKPSIQKTIEKSLEKILQEPVQLIASGRTDAGVHAYCQVANFKTASRISLAKLHEGLNAILPEDISISKISEAGLNFHSRASAKSKIYRYTILNSRHRRSLLRGQAYFLRFPLDVDLMRKEAKPLIGKHDFTAFCSSGSKVRSKVRNIKNLKISKKQDLITVEIEADGFLYNMVRSIVGTLIDLGRGKNQGLTMKGILDSRDRKLSGPTAPAKGLCLIKVKY